MELMHGLQAGTDTVMVPVRVDEQGRLTVVVADGGASAGVTEVLVTNAVTNPVPTQAVEIASNGVSLPLSSLMHEFAYSDGLLESVEVVYGGVTYRQSLVWNIGLLVSVSAWEPQP